MKISNQLPQFKDENALLIVTGETIAKLYFASQGKINELEIVEPHKADYPYRQGINLRAGGGRNYLWQSYSVNDDWRQKEFLEFFKERISHLLKELSVTKMFIFSPQEEIKLIKKALPKSSHKIIEGEFGKNYTKEHPFRLLEIIKEKQQEHLGESVPLSKSARNILNKGTQTLGQAQRKKEGK